MVVEYVLYSILALIFFVLAITFYDKNSEYGKLYRKFPGPEPHWLVGNLFLVLKYDPLTMFAQLRQWAKEYRIYKLMPWSYAHYSCLCIVHPSDVQLILSNSNNNDKSDIYLMFREWLGYGLLISNGEKWHERRKILTPTFHFNILKRFVPIFNKHARTLADTLQDESNNTEVNIIHHMHTSTMRSVAESAMGIFIDDTESEKKYRDSVTRMGELFYYRLLRPWFYFRPPWFFTKFFFEERFLLRYLHNLTKSKIRERQRNFDPKICEDSYDDEEGAYKSKKRVAMLDLLLLAKQNKEIDDEGIREEVDTFTFEGHDTVSNAISFTFLLLANHPDVQQKVYDEIKSILGDRDQEPSYQDMHKMIYMDRVIKETLRLYPSVPLISRITGNQPLVTEEGHVIPPRTNLLIHIFDTHRLPEFFPEPDKFDPDRFLPEACENRHPYAYVPFSAGPRNCIGQKFAMLTMKSMITAVLKNFLLLPVDTPETIVLVCDMVIRSRDGVKVKLQKRI